TRLQVACAACSPLLTGKLSQGGDTMADKTSFTKDEWALLLRSPLNAGMAITAAEPSGLFGLLKESFAGGAALAQAATDPNTNPLIKAVVSDFQTSEGRCACRKSNPAILTVQSAQDWTADNASGCLDDT